MSNQLESGAQSVKHQHQLTKQELYDQISQKFEKLQNEIGRSKQINETGNDLLTPAPELEKDILQLGIVARQLSPAGSRQSKRRMEQTEDRGNGSSLMVVNNQPEMKMYRNRS
jgi:hypothetical protein